jgi:hypothetical protein
VLPHLALTGSGARVDPMENSMKVVLIVDIAKILMALAIIADLLK